MADGRGGIIQIAGVGVGSQPIALAEVAIHLQPDDDVAVATRELAPRQLIAGPFGPLKVTRLVPVGHKVALRAIPDGGAVHRYGQIIGFATAPISPGDHVHSHNLGVHDFARDYAVGVDVRPVDFVRPEARRTFQGYLPRRWAGGHPQLRGDHLHRQLQRHRHPRHRRPLPAWPARALPERRRGDPAHTQGRLRRALRRPGGRSAAAHPGRLCPPPECRGLRDRRAWAARSTRCSDLVTRQGLDGDARHCS